MKEQIFAALTAYTPWKQKLAQSIDTGIISEDIPRHIKQLSEYEEVRQVHAQFHKFTSQIIMLAMLGEKEKAKLLLEDGSEYLQLSDRLRSALLALAKISTQQLSFSSKYND